MRFLHATLGHHRVGTLFDIHLEIKKGEWVFLDGDSGAGKTTFLETVFGTLKPLSGALVDDRERDVYRLSSSALRSYRRTCGMIFQDHKLMPTKTVAENIAYALEICGYSQTTIRTRTRELLSLVHMTAKADAFPESLSGGEAQRVAIARALIHEPSVILADEPTASLDTKNTRMIIELLHDIQKRGTTVIFATHDHDLYDFVPEGKVIDLHQWR